MDKILADRDIAVHPLAKEERFTRHAFAAGVALLLVHSDGDVSQIETQYFRRLCLSLALPEEDHSKILEQVVYDDGTILNIVLAELKTRKQRKMFVDELQKAALVDGALKSGEKFLIMLYAKLIGKEPQPVSSNQGVIKQNGSKLVWTSNANLANSALNFIAAELLVNELNSKYFAGLDGWRLPTIEELLDVIHWIGRDVENLQRDVYWSSESSLIDGYIKQLNCENFTTESIHKKSDLAYVWPVCG
ncbi:DUF1566 domain-containing protein [Candidatus Nomurabacteria bacterium]|nr:DUF1566 domain-containing protein [Candidatus Nomurabacteria bacterium]